LPNIILLGIAIPKDYDGKTELFSISLRINGFTIKTFKAIKKKTNKKGAFDHLFINVKNESYEFIVEESYEFIIEESNEKTGFLN